MKIIGLVGRKHSGKDTIASCLYDLKGDGVLLIAFADKLKSMASIMSGIPYSHFHDQEKKEVRCHRVVGFGDRLVSPRDVLIEYGNMYRDWFGDDYFVWHVLSKIEKERENYDIIVVTDVRFENECRALKELGSDIYYVSRDDYLGPLPLDSDKSELSVMDVKEKYDCRVLDNNYYCKENEKLTLVENDDGIFDIKIEKMGVPTSEEAFL